MIRADAAPGAANSRDLDVNANLRQIEVFCVLAEVLHFGRAAERLFVTQAMVSQEIRRLETQLGARLFDRTTRRVALTEFGEQLLPFAQEVHQASRTLNAMATRLRQPSAAVRLAATPSAMDGLVPSILQEAEKRDLAIDESEVATGSVVAAMESAECDLGIGRFLHGTPHLQTEHLYSEEVCVLISAQHPLSSQPTIDLALLSDLPLLLWPRELHPEYHDALVTLCNDRGLDPLVMTAKASITGARSYLLQEGRVFAIVPRASARTAPAGVVSRPLSEPAELPMSIIWRKNDARPHVHQLIALIRRVAAARFG